MRFDAKCFNLNCFSHFTTYDLSSSCHRTKFESVSSASGKGNMSLRFEMSGEMEESVKSVTCSAPVNIAVIKYCKLMFSLSLCHIYLE